MSVISNLKKTYYYAGKNGFLEAFYAVRERAYAKNCRAYPDYGYSFCEISKEEYQRQERYSFSAEPRISILVPAYETDAVFLKEMINSVLTQTYGKWELVIADASVSSRVYEELSMLLQDNTGWQLEDSTSEIKKWNETVKKQSCILYRHLPENKGISENTNQALQLATGDYIGLLDHDDLLTCDALYEMVAALNRKEAEGKRVAFLYSDEDKCDSSGKKFYDPNIKLEFNLDYLFSNNYICHFLLMNRSLMTKLKFRKNYDGAQDFDLILRASIDSLGQDRTEIVHVNRVLYHWRCHDGSTAANPESKRYAYEAGRKAVESALQMYLKTLGAIVQTAENTELETGKDGFYVNGIRVSVLHTMHNGFYRVQYGNGTPRELFLVRTDVAGITWPAINKRKITDNILNKEGKTLYEGLPEHVSGYLHRAVLQQDVYAAKKETVILREELQKIECKEYVTTDDFKKYSYNCLLYDPLFRPE